MKVPPSGDLGALKMKKITLILALLLPLTITAQKGNQGARQQKIQAAKIGLITEKLNLTTEQAPQFWAVYNEFDRKRIENRKAIKKTFDETNSLANSDDKIVSNHKQILNLRRKELDLEEEYAAKLMKTINPRQFAELKRTEANFNKMLMEKLRERVDDDDN
jgi:Spy/CpxP family protein refolding chaperone